MTRRSRAPTTLQFRITSAVTLACTAFAAACAPEGAVTPDRARLIADAAPPSAAAKFSDWSAPVSLGPVVNSTSSEQNAQLSKDELSLYFTSNRPGGFGALDLYVTRRASVDDPWGPPVNLGAAVNTPSNDFGPNVSIDGHLLFFASGRPGGQGGADLYMSWRDDVNDDLAWSTPVNLGAPINTADNEQAPNYHQNAEEGGGNIYFNRGNMAAGRADLYFAGVTRDGVSYGPVTFVMELNSPVNEAAATLRHDAKEIFFFSSRPGGLGSTDIWTSTRQNANAPWSPPTNVTELNTPAGDVTPNLSFDGLTMIFGSNRPGTLGENDLFMATRTRVGGND